MATQEIGIPLDLNQGVFNNTVFKDGKLQLVELGKDDSNTPIYVPEGYWISEPIRIADKVALFKYVAKTISGTGNYNIYTQSSPDSYAWTEWEQVDASTGTITTPVGYFARVKILISPTNSNVTLTIDGFDVVDKYDNAYVNSSDGVLEIKQSYRDRMTKLGNDGLLTRSIPKSFFKKIDKLLFVE
ncbi:hypothetical protein [Paenibacillus sp. FSL H3-0333]|uniref:hypothetical protein n=1 Tax=Paenibacillus sp. FSL H3-0333 TaxID=2921373 RepID=UPI0030F8628B